MHKASERAKNFGTKARGEHCCRILLRERGALREQDGVTGTQGRGAGEKGGEGGAGMTEKGGGNAAEGSEKRENMGRANRLSIMALSAPLCSSLPSSRDATGKRVN